MSRGKTGVSLCLMLVVGAAMAATAPTSPPKPTTRQQQASHNAMLPGSSAATTRVLQRAGKSAFATAIDRDQLEYRHPVSNRHLPPFRIPELRGMDLYPGEAVVGRYVLPPPPWIHVHVHCVVSHGEVYIDGTVTGNFGRPIPGWVVYQGHGEVVTGSVTSSQSGQLHGIEPLMGGDVVAPPGLSKFPMYCVKPDVSVGVPSRVTRNGRQAARHLHDR